AAGGGRGAPPSQPRKPVRGPDRPPAPRGPAARTGRRGGRADVPDPGGGGGDGRRGRVGGPRRAPALGDRPPAPPVSRSGVLVPARAPAGGRAVHADAGAPPGAVRARRARVRAGLRQLARGPARAARPVL